MAKPLILNEIRSRAAQFVFEWKDAEGYERGEAQSFIRDLLGVYGITRSRAGLYEVRVTRSSSGERGYIDALVPGVAAIEMKSAGKDLAAAERQALDYLDSLNEAELPRWVLTSDFRRFRLLDLQAPDPTHSTVEFDLGELPKHAERLSFFATRTVRQLAPEQQEAASIKAARLMAGLYEALEGSGYDDHEASVFLVRTLFALYADDAGVWDPDLFLEFVGTRTSEDGSDLGPQLSLLYQVLATPRDRRQTNLDELLAQFPYVNGGVFGEPLMIPTFDSAMRHKLLDACRFNWSAISPAVFGSLFQAVKDKVARRELGEHYTTETNILKVIEPMFLDELRDRFEKAKDDAAALRKLRAAMGAMRFLDPACGCGNFLVVAYREMRALDLRVLIRLQELALLKQAPTLMFDVTDLPVQLGHFHGIELEEWPARIAATALHLVEHQANLAMELALGQGPETLPLDKVETIHVGNALRTDWTTVVEPTDQLYVLGNPPFVGQYTKGADQTADMQYVWGRQYDGYLDYVTGWFIKALQTFTKPGYGGEFAFVSTNSVTQGQPVPALFGPIFKAGWRIKFAHRTFAWTSEAPGAAAVHCVIIGFDTHPRRPARLFDYDGNLKGAPRESPVKDQINAYLIDGPNVLVSKAMTPTTGMPEVAYGKKMADDGHLIVEPSDYATVASDPVAAKYLRPFIGARELLHGEQRWCLWLTNLDPAELQKSKTLRDRVQATRDWRSRQTRSGDAYRLRDTPHLSKSSDNWSDVPHLVIPRHASETRAFFPSTRVDPTVLVGDANFTAEDPDGFAFAILSSSAFIVWQRAVGGRIKSDLRFSNTLTWNTFPLPPLSAAQRAAIIAGGVDVLNARAAHPDRSLADHYNPLGMDPKLVKAHHTLDAAVDAAFGLKGKVDEDARLRALFASYQRLSDAGQGKLPLGKAGRARRTTR